jgi:hypothetical protein
MRSPLARLVFTGLVGLAGFAVAGCGTNGASSSIASLPNSNGGGAAPTTNLPTSSTTPAPLTANPVQIDNGTEYGTAATPTPVPTGATPLPSPAIYKGILGTSASEVQLAGTSGGAPYPTGGPPTAPLTYPKGIAEHQVTFGGGNTAQVFLQLQKIIPSLVYNMNSTSPTGAAPTYFAYSTIVMYLTYAPSVTTPPPALSSVSAEISGSDTAGSFDVRVSCTGTPGTGVPAPVTCGPLPALNAVSNVTGPSPVLPGSLLAFDPATNLSPKFTIVLNYSNVVLSSEKGNVLDVGDVYATQ